MPGDSDDEARYEDRFDTNEEEEEEEEESSDSEEEEDEMVRRCAGKRWTEDEVAAALEAYQRGARVSETAEQEVLEGFVACTRPFLVACLQEPSPAELARLQRFVERITTCLLGGTLPRTRLQAALRGRCVRRVLPLCLRLGDRYECCQGAITRTLNTFKSLCAETEAETTSGSTCTARLIPDLVAALSCKPLAAVQCIGAANSLTRWVMGRSRLLTEPQFLVDLATETLLFPLRQGATADCTASASQPAGARRTPHKGEDAQSIAARWYIVAGTLLVELAAAPGQGQMQVGGRQRFVDALARLLDVHYALPEHVIGCAAARIHQLGLCGGDALPCGAAHSAFSALLLFVTAHVHSQGMPHTTAYELLQSILCRVPNLRALYLILCPAVYDAQVFDLVVDLAFKFATDGAPRASSAAALPSTTYSSLFAGSSSTSSSSTNNMRTSTSTMPMALGTTALACLPSEMLALLVDHAESDDVPNTVFQRAMFLLCAHEDTRGFYGDELPAGFAQESESWLALIVRCAATDAVQALVAADAASIVAGEDASSPANQCRACLRRLVAAAPPGTAADFVAALTPLFVRAPALATLLFDDLLAKSVPRRAALTCIASLARAAPVLPLARRRVALDMFADRLRALLAAGAAGAGPTTTAESRAQRHVQAAAAEENAAFLYALAAIMPAVVGECFADKGTAEGAKVAAAAVRIVETVAQSFLARYLRKGYTRAATPRTYYFVLYSALLRYPEPETLAALVCCCALVSAIHNDVVGAAAGATTTCSGDVNSSQKQEQQEEEQTGILLPAAASQIAVSAVAAAHARQWPLQHSRALLTALHSVLGCFSEAAARTELAVHRAALMTLADGMANCRAAARPFALLLLVMTATVGEHGGLPTGCVLDVTALLSAVAHHMNMPRSRKEEAVIVDVDPRLFALPPAVCDAIFAFASRELARLVPLPSQTGTSHRGNRTRPSCLTVSYLLRLMSATQRSTAQRAAVIETCWRVLQGGARRTVVPVSDVQEALLRAFLARHCVSERFFNQLVPPHQRRASLSSSSAVQQIGEEDEDDAEEEFRDEYAPETTELTEKGAVRLDSCALTALGDALSRNIDALPIEGGALSAARTLAAQLRACTLGCRGCVAPVLVRAYLRVLGRLLALGVAPDAAMATDDLTARDEACGLLWACLCGASGPHVPPEYAPALLRLLLRYAHARDTLHVLAAVAAFCCGTVVGESAPFDACCPEAAARYPPALTCTLRPGDALQLLCQCLAATGRRVAAARGTGVGVARTLELQMALHYTAALLGRAQPLPDALQNAAFALVERCFLVLERAFYPPLLAHRAAQALHTTMLISDAERREVDIFTESLRSWCSIAARAALPLPEKQYLVERARGIKASNTQLRRLLHMRVTNVDDQNEIVTPPTTSGNAQNAAPTPAAPAASPPRQQKKQATPRRSPQRRTRSRNAFIDANLDDRTKDTFADLEDFIECASTNYARQETGAVLDRVAGVPPRKKRQSKQKREKREMTSH